MHPRSTPPAPRGASIALGTWALAGERPGAWGYGPCPPEVARRTVEAALAAGCRRFDTAAAFGGGAVERLLGEVLGGRDDVAVTTRVGMRLGPGGAVPDFAPEALAAQVAESARRLGRVSLDRVLLHLPAPAVVRDGRAFAALLGLKADGRVREVGASVQEPEEALALAAAGADWLCLPYGPANRKFEAAIGEIRRRGARVQVREVLQNGRLTDRPRDPAGFTPADVRFRWPAWVLARLAELRARLAAAVPDRPVEHTAIGYARGLEGVAEVCVGCRGEPQVAAAFGAPPLDAAARERVNAALYGGPEGPAYGSSPRAAASMASISSSDRP
jgi:aryl-alcohol dehydrogenase-like predicted oxidoreductase